MCGCCRERNQCPDKHTSASAQDVVWLAFGVFHTWIHINQEAQAWKQEQLMRCQWKGVTAEKESEQASLVNMTCTECFSDVAITLDADSKPHLHV